MENKQTYRVSSGIGFFEALALIFITLKLIGTISWSWWLVLCPLAIHFIFFGVISLIIGGLLVTRAPLRKNS